MGQKKEKKKRGGLRCLLPTWRLVLFSHGLLRSEKAVHMLHGSQGYNSGEERIENKSKGEAESVEDR